MMDGVSFHVQQMEAYHFLRKAIDLCYSLGGSFCCRIQFLLNIYIHGIIAREKIFNKIRLAMNIIHRPSHPPRSTPYSSNALWDQYRYRRPQAQ